jgi:hypothetical protein
VGDVHAVRRIAVDPVSKIDPRERVQVTGLLVDISGGAKESAPMEDRQQLSYTGLNLSQIEPKRKSGFVKSVESEAASAACRFHSPSGDIIRQRFPASCESCQAIMIRLRFYHDFCKVTS